MAVCYQGAGDETFRWKVKPDMEVNLTAIVCVKCVLVPGTHSVWRQG